MYVFVIILFESLLHSPTYSTIKNKTLCIVTPVLLKLEVLPLCSLQLNKQNRKACVCSTYLYITGQLLGQSCKSQSGGCNSITACRASNHRCSVKMARRHTARSITLPRGTSKTLVCCRANHSLLTVLKLGA